MKTRIKSPGRVLWVALVLGWMVDWFFYGKQLGGAFLLFALTLTGVLWGIGRAEGIQPVRRNAWLLIPLLFFAGMVFVRANGAVTTLNVLATLALLGYLAFFYAAGRVEALGVAGAFLVPLRVGGNSLYQAAPAVSAGVDMKRVRQQGRRHIFPLLRGGLLALPVLVVFTLLLAAADLVFADYLDEIASLEFLPDLVEWFWRGLLILLAAWVLAGGFAYALGRRDTADDRAWLQKGLDVLPRRIPLGFTESGTILTLVNLLFMAFVAIQFTYLFGGRANIHREGYTYAQYARSGFFELVAVAVLSLALILFLDWLTRRQSKRQIRAFNLFSSVTVGFVLVLLASAFYRMQLYEATYGYTQLRLFVTIFMVWLGALLVWFLLTRWRRPDRFAIGLILAVMGCLATVNLTNPDAFIARQNLARYQATGKLDAAYLTRLSDDAMPELIHALALVQGDDQEVLTPSCSYSWRWESEGGCYATPAAILRDELDGRFQLMQEDPGWQRWQSFHLARWRAYNLLTRALGD